MKTLSLDEHARIGQELQDIRSKLLLLHLQIDDTYFYINSDGEIIKDKIISISKKSVEDIDKLIDELSKKLFQEHFSKDNPYIPHLGETNG
jgi:hypothetical protein